MLNGHYRMVGVLAAAGPAEALATENGVGTTALEMATAAALSSGLRDTKRAAPSQESALSVRHYFYSSHMQLPLEPLPGWKETDKEDIQKLREVIDRAAGSGVLAKKPEVLEGLSQYATSMEQALSAALAQDDAGQADPEEDDKGVGAYHTHQPASAAKALEALKKYAPSHPRVLVHLKDIQDVILRSVRGAGKAKATRGDEDGGLEDEDTESEDRAQFLLHGKSWVQPKDNF